MNRYMHNGGICMQISGAHLPLCVSLADSGARPLHTQLGFIYAFNITLLYKLTCKLAKQKGALSTTLLVFCHQSNNGEVVAILRFYTRQSALAPDILWMDA